MTPLAPLYLYLQSVGRLCNEKWIGESKRRISEQIVNHNGGDLKSHPLKHSIESEHKNLSQKHFKVLVKNFKHNTWKGKTAESLLMKKISKNNIELAR